MTAQQKNIVLVCFLFIVAALLSVHFMLGPRYQTALTTRTSLETALESKRKRLAAINDIKVPLAKLETSMNQIESVGLPKGEQLPDLIELVEQALLSQKDMTLVNFTPSVGKSAATEVSGGYVESPYSVTVKGPSSKLATVLEVLNSSIRPMYVKSVSITPSADTDAPDTIQAVISVGAFSIPGTSSAGAISTGTP